MSFEAFMEDPYDDLHSKKEIVKSENQQSSLESCGQKWSYRTDWSGEIKKTTNTCKDYRRCDKFCRYAKWEEIEKKIHHGELHMELGDRLRFLQVTTEERPAFIKKLNRGGFEYFSFPQPEEVCIIIYNNPDGEGDELWDYGYDDIDLYNEDNGLDLNFYTILKNVPDKKKITGTLGLPQHEEEEEDEGDGDEELREEKKTSVKVACLYKPDLTERDAHLAYVQAIIKTQNIKVETAIDLEMAMAARINAMNEVLGNTAVVYHTWDAVSDSEILLWNSNPNNFSEEENVRIRPIGDSYRSYSDISDKNHKQSSFEAIVDRSERGDSLDDERKKAIDDYIRFHGT